MSFQKPIGDHSSGNAVDVVCDFLFSHWFGLSLLFNICAQTDGHRRDTLYDIMMTWAAALLILTLHENVFG